MDYRSMVRDFVVQECLEEGAEGELSDDSPIFRTGVLNSMNLIRLVDLIETKTDIKVGAHEITEEHFGSIKTIVAFIQSRATATAPAQS